MTKFHANNIAPTIHWRRALLAAVLTTCLALAGVTLVGPSTAGAVGSRSSQVKVNCTLGGRSNAPTAVAGTAYACAVNVGDTGTGTTVLPTGTATLSVAGTAGTAPVEPCTLQPVKSWDTSCTIYLAVYSAGTFTVSANYSGDATFAAATVASGDQVSGVTTSAGSNVSVLATIAGTNGSSTSQISATGTFTVYASNCATASGTVSGYVLGGSVDPATNTPQAIIGPFTVTNRAFSWTVTLGASDVGTYVARFACATGPVTSNSDPDIILLSNAFTSTITAASGALRTSATGDRTSTVAARVAAASDDPGALPRAARLSHDVDGLNAIDRMGIFKESADLLKARTDRLVSSSGPASRLGYMLVDGGLDRAELERWSTGLAGGAVSPTDVADHLLARPDASAYTRGSDATFVSGAYLRGAGRAADESELAAAAAALAAGRATRAQVAAAVAMSAESAAQWQDRSYVVAAYQATTARVPDAGEVAGAVARLQSGTLKVNVVEDIALLGASASAWNEAAPAGRTPSSATFGPAAAPPGQRPAATPPAPATRHVATGAGRPRATARRTNAHPSRKGADRRTKVRKPARRKVVARRTASVHAAGR